MEQGKAKGAVSRRDFLKETAFVTAGAAALGGLAPARVLGANDRLRVAVLGSGQRARYLASIFVKQPSVEIVEVCDVYGPHRRAGMKVAGAKATGTGGLPRGAGSQGY